MRIDIKKVKNHRYMQYVTRQGFLVHCGPVGDFESWRLAFHLLDEDLESEAINQFLRLKPIFCDVFKPKSDEEYQRMLVKAWTAPSEKSRDRALEILNRKYEEREKLNEHFRENQRIEAYQG